LQFEGNGFGLKVFEKNNETFQEVFMKLEMTKNQFKTLIELVYLGNWLANSHREEGEIKKYNDLEKEIFSMTKKFGLSQFTDEEGYPTADFEDTVGELIEEYDEDTFWVELVDRMARRDFFRKYSKKQLKQMNPDQQFEELYKITAKYEEIFEKNGLDALTILGPIKI
jgi:hypothetical protein